MLQIVLWKWDQPGFRVTYTAEHVNVMCAMLRRNLRNFPHRIVCVTDNSDGITECETAAIWPDHNGLANASGKQLPSCYRRLKLYNPETQRDELGIDKGDRIMSIDLDALITGDVRGIAQTEGLFVGWELTGEQGRKVFNGSLQIFTAGELADVWSSFDHETSPREALTRGYRGSDQAWISYCLLGKGRERLGLVGLKWPEVASYPLQTRIQGILKTETRMIFFHGREKPWTAQAIHNTPWIERYWRL